MLELITVTVKVGDVSITMTVDELKKLRDELNKLLPEKPAPFVVPYCPPCKPWWEQQPWGHEPWTVTYTVTTGDSNA